MFSFKQPSNEELDHDYLWRYVRGLPERGRIGIFNRSYYEEVLVVRVHPEILQRQQLPTKQKENPDIWQQRFTQINNFEKYLNRQWYGCFKVFSQRFVRRTKVAVFRQNKSTRKKLEIFLLAMSRKGNFGKTI